MIGTYVYIYNIRIQNQQQRKELSTKVDIWALGCIFYALAFLQHPFPEGNKMAILDASYKIPVKHPYSKKVTKLLKLLLHKELKELRK